MLGITKVANSEFGFVALENFLTVSPGGSRRPQKTSRALSCLSMPARLGSREPGLPARRICAAFLSPDFKRAVLACLSGRCGRSTISWLTFAKTFYTALKDKETLAEATRDARELAKTNKEFPWLSYSVYGNPFARA